MKRHKFRFLDLSGVAAAALCVLYAGYNVDIFANSPHHHPNKLELEGDELLAVVLVLALGLLWALNRLRRERKQAVEKAAVEDQIRALAFQDSLTGLPNRRSFEDSLDAALASPPRAGGCHAVFMLDLNGFKRINDTFGHAAGDQLLRHVGTRLSHVMRRGDLVARLGGDEFVVLATQLPSSESATGLALRVIEALKDPIVTSFGTHKIGTGIGVALAPHDSLERDDLLRKADIALYRAKEESASSMRFFESEMDTSIRERHKLEQDLKTAVDQDEIFPAYQPLIDLKSGRVRDLECLARWQHPELGAIPPDRFISIAEDNGLISKLTDTLLTRACTEACKWADDVGLAVNLSAVLLRDEALPARVKSILQQTGLAPKRLELEVTESAMVRDLGAAQKILGELRSFGVRIALDDFGTGYSSLYHLRNLQVDKIKIDRSFVGAMLHDAESHAIVQALVGLGSGLGLEVTAEGVETEEQRRLLAQHGCKQAQGFLYSEAVPADQVEAMLAKISRGIHIERAAA